MCSGIRVAYHDIRRPGEARTASEGDELEKLAFADSPADLQKELAGHLDAITLKALNLDVSRRYSSVEHAGSGDLYVFRARGASLTFVGCVLYRRSEPVAVAYSGSFDSP